jgi:hypothetical protein
VSRASRRGNRRDIEPASSGRLSRRAKFGVHKFGLAASKIAASRTAAPKSQKEAKAKAEGPFKPKKKSSKFGGIKGALATRAARSNPVLGGSGGGIAGAAASAFAKKRRGPSRAEKKNLRKYKGKRARFANTGL